MEHFVNNRDVIKNPKINTGTSANPTMTGFCTASSLALNTDFTKQEFFTFCDAIQRSITTGVSMVIDGTVKIDMNNSAIRKVLGDVHTLISTGAIAQFNNQLFEFDLLTGVSGGVLEYTTYRVPVSFTLESLGGDAEGVGEFAISLAINGTSISA